jgi:spore coat protein U-like protein
MQSRGTMKHLSLLTGLMMIVTSAHGVIDCSVTSLPTLNFGNYNPFSVTALDVATAASVRCTSTRRNGESVFLSTSLARGTAPSFNPRQMRDALSNVLAYNLYTNSARTTIYGDGSAGTSTRSTFLFPTRAVPAVFTDDIFGRITPGQDVRIGSYSDTLIYTINF